MICLWHLVIWWVQGCNLGVILGIDKTNSRFISILRWRSNMNMLSMCIVILLLIYILLMLLMSMLKKWIFIYSQLLIRIRWSIFFNDNVTMIHKILNEVFELQTTCCRMSFLSMIIVIFMLSKLCVFRFIFRIFSCFKVNHHVNSH